MAEMNRLRRKIFSEKKNPSRIMLFLCFDDEFNVSYPETKRKICLKKQANFFLDLLSVNLVVARSSRSFSAFIVAVIGSLS